MAASEQVVDALTQTGSLSKGNQQGDRLGRHHVLGVVQVQVARLGRQGLTAGVVLGEELTEVGPADLASVVEQSAPLARAGDRDRRNQRAART